jgi:isopentenyl-diphosphate Delta-isomerase
MTSEELIGMVDDTDRIIGSSTIPIAHKDGLPHREVYMYLINAHNEILLQRRVDNGLWDHSSAGHFPKDESYSEAAVREFFEELGIKLQKKDFTKIGYERLETITAKKRNIRFVTIYVVKKDIALSDFRLQKEEVEEVKYFSATAIRKLIAQGQQIAHSTQYVIQRYILPLVIKGKICTPKV